MLQPFVFEIYHNIFNKIFQNIVDKLLNNNYY
jgi:hypothetical protein